jgi:cob(I)alamin adenosyltransferase
MLRIMKIYTRTGDDGTTGMLGPGRVRKSSPRIEAYGTVDELNAVLGVARALAGVTALDELLGGIQSTLFTVGAQLATVAPQLRETLDRVGDADVQLLESAIDAFEAELPALTTFVLPAGTPLATELHLARTVCRRAERRVVTLAEHEDVDATVLRYLNRLADLLFVMARVANHRAGVTETPWRARPRP